MEITITNTVIQFVYFIKLLELKLINFTRNVKQHMPPFLALDTLLVILL
jgi:hypothetical protein